MRDALQSVPRKGSRSSRIGTWLAVIGVVVAVAALLAARAGIMLPLAAMGAYAAASLLLLLAAIFAAIGLLRSGGTAGTASRNATWLALLVGLAVTVGNGLTLARGMKAPPIHDITTDTTNPPAFVAILPLRRLDARNAADYAGPAVAAVQEKAFPDIRPLVVPQPVEAVFAAARAVVTDRGWTLVDASLPDGRIEATAETPWMHFKDDVVIRIRQEADGTRVDMRSTSRVGKGDLGVNAARVRDFLASLKSRLATG